MREYDPLIREFQHEKFRPRESEALLTLRKVASLVKPIMRQRGWKVGILCEFYPPEQNLLGLNWNHGQKICLRLRYPGDQRQFMPIEEVLDTMLHELCHIVHGPHNNAFNALWNQLRDDHTSLSMKGYTGEGFLTTGHRLGGVSRYPRPPPMHEARRRTQAEAEKRRNLTSSSSSGDSGRRLGGAPVLRGTDMRKVIADAAQRRIDITKGCGVGREKMGRVVEEAERKGTRTRAEQEQEDEVMILDEWISLLDDDEDGGVPSSSYFTPAPLPPPPPRVPAATKPQLPPFSNTSSYPPSFSSSKINQEPDSDTGTTPSSSAYNTSWTCPICTLINPPTYLCCDACTTERPPSTFSTSQTQTPTRPKSKLTTTGTTSTPQSQSRLRRSNTTTTSSSSFSTRHKSTRSSASASTSIFNNNNKNGNGELGGWICAGCGNWMENEWWTCAGCGRMKESS
ncbi:MAG: hypothetical protein M1834_002324 [Cirrosporium novae-zelandiae]|nr:MAG: hypothetical protein M1834_002324 [Cirrosporium novae-zelandiae]